MTIKPKFWGENSSFHPRLIAHSTPETEGLVNSIRVDRTGGEPLRNKLRELGRIMGERVSEEESLQSGIIVGIARSGTDMSYGLYEVMPHFSHTILNLKDQRENILQRFDRDPLLNQTLILMDAVIVTGLTIHEVLTLLLGKYSFDSAIVITALTGRAGAENLLQNYPFLTIHTGEIEETTVTFDLHRYKIRKTLPNIGNIGELVSRP